MLTRIKNVSDYLKNEYFLFYEVITFNRRL